jgi:hypothetical protein
MRVQVTVSIVACVERTTTTTTITTAGTTPEPTTAAKTTASAETAAPTTAAETTASPEVTTSGTTVAPTSVATTSGCKKDMTVVDSGYVSDVSYSTPPVNGSNRADLTSTNGSGISFESTGVTIIMKLKSGGVDSIGSITVNGKSNVNEIRVEIVIASGDSGTSTISVVSTIVNGTVTISQLPATSSPILEIRITIVSTNDGQ